MQYSASLHLQEVKHSDGLSADQQSITCDLTQDGFVLLHSNVHPLIVSTNTQSMEDHGHALSHALGPFE